jgi:hypothetical protein
MGDSFRLGLISLNLPGERRCEIGFALEGHSRCCKRAAPYSVTSAGCHKSEGKNRLEALGTTVEVMTIIFGSAKQRTSEVQLS